MEIYVVEFVRTLVSTLQLRVEQVLNYDPRLSVFKGRIHFILLDLLDELLDYTLKLLNECVPRLDILLQFLHLELLLLLGDLDRLEQIVVHLLLLVQILTNLVHLLCHSLVLELFGF